MKQIKINKPIRLIELFAGIGAQAKALKNLGVAVTYRQSADIGQLRK